MAIVQNPLIGKSKQSVGGSTFTSWKGRNVLKSKPLEVANPKTIGQITQRNKLTLAVFVYRQIAGAILLGYKELAATISEYNAFISYTMRNAINTDALGVATLNAPNLLVSRGTIGIQPIIGAVGSSSNPDITLTIASDVLPVGGSLTDRNIAVVYNATKNEWGMSLDTVDRQDDDVDVSLPTTPDPGDTIHAFLGWYNPSSGKASDSAYSIVTLS